MDHSHQHQHQHFHDMMAKRQNGATTSDGTVYSVVYVTASPTFTGVIGGYTTLTGSGSTEAGSASSSGGQTLVPPTVTSSSASLTSVVGFPSNSQSSVFSSAGGSSAAASTAPSNFLTSATQSSGSDGASNTAVDGASSTSGASSSSSSSSGGISTGAKAGLAIGIIALIGIVAALLLWFLGKKRREQEENDRANDEKTTFGASQTAVPMTRNPTSAAAPRLSLRPMSKMMDGFMGGSNRRSAGNLLTTVSEGGPAAGAARGPSPQPRTVSPLRPEQSRLDNPFADPQNPFADPAPAPVRAPAPAPLRPSPASAPIAPPQAYPAPRTNFNPNIAPPSQSRAINLDAPSPAPTLPSSSPMAPLALGAAAGFAAAGTAAKSSPPARSRSPEAALPIQKPDSPERAREGAASPDPDSAPMPPTIAAAMQSPTPSGASDAQGGNVYRVLMDFVPSMDDELELKSGQLVRCLHEYDDGWALCIRLDRSQQGVVPRTCLAAKPSKPKPSHLNQYARGPGGNGPPMSPAGMQRPMSPGMGRPMSPGMGRPASPAGMQRPMSPGMGRPMSPASGYGPGPRNGPPRGPPRGPPGRSMSPGGFNQAPRPLSPGPRPQQRSQSPGPYGASGPSPMAGVQQRRRSNSTNALNVRDRRMSPPGPSNLGPSGRPTGGPGTGGPYPGGMRPMSPGIAL